MFRTDSQPLGDWLEAHARLTLAELFGLSTVSAVEATCDQAIQVIKGHRSLDPEKRGQLFDKVDAWCRTACDAIEKRSEPHHVAPSIPHPRPRGRTSGVPAPLAA